MPAQDTQVVEIAIVKADLQDDDYHQNLNSEVRPANIIGKAGGLIEEMKARRQQQAERNQHGFHADQEKTLGRDVLVKDPNHIPKPQCNKPRPGRQIMATRTVLGEILPNKAPPEYCMKPYSAVNWRLGVITRPTLTAICRLSMVARTPCSSCCSPPLSRKDQGDPGGAQYQEPNALT